MASMLLLVQDLLNFVIYNIDGVPVSLGYILAVILIVSVVALIWGLFVG
jgi:hypothetical protein